MRSKRRWIPALGRNDGGSCLGRRPLTEAFRGDIRGRFFHDSADYEAGCGGRPRAGEA